MDIADTNEYHPLVDAEKYSTWSEAVILRAHNGYREDNAYAGSIALVHAVPAIRAVGHYGYVVAGLDAASQGKDFANIVKLRGGLRPGHFISFDLEEGAGDQAPRAAAWMAGAHSVLQDPVADEFGYAGANYWQAHLWSVNTVHRWIAAYGQATAPPMGEVLWQFTDAQVAPGVVGACDCSLFVGDVDMLLALIGTTAPPQEEDVKFIFECQGQPTYVQSGNLVWQTTDIAPYVAQGFVQIRVSAADIGKIAAKASPLPASQGLQKITLTGTETPG